MKLLGSGVDIKSIGGALAYGRLLPFSTAFQLTYYVSALKSTASPRRRALPALRKILRNLGLSSIGLRK